MQKAYTTTAKKDSEASWNQTNNYMMGEKITLSPLADPSVGFKSPDLDFDTDKTVIVCVYLSLAWLGSCHGLPVMLWQQTSWCTGWLHPGALPHSSYTESFCFQTSWPPESVGEVKKKKGEAVKLGCFTTNSA